MFYKRQSLAAPLTVAGSDKLRMTAADRLVAYRMDHWFAETCAKAAAIDWNL